MAQTDAASPPGTAMTPPAAAAPAGRGGKLSHADRSFMKEAAQAGSAEVASAQLAEGKSGDAKVQAFAKQMIGDHAEAGDALKSLAASKGLDLPAGPSVTRQAKDKVLAAHDGAAFDRSYAKTAVDDHEDAVELFRNSSTQAKDADVRAFAQKTLPTLEHHADGA